MYILYTVLWIEMGWAMAWDDPKVQDLWRLFHFDGLVLRHLAQWPSWPSWEVCLPCASLRGQFSQIEFISHGSLRATCLGLNSCGADWKNFDAEGQGEIKETCRCSHDWLTICPLCLSKKQGQSGDWLTNVAGAGVEYQYFVEYQYSVDLSRRPDCSRPAADDLIASESAVF